MNNLRMIRRLILMMALALGMTMATGCGEEAGTADTAAEAPAAENADEGTGNDAETEDAGEVAGNDAGDAGNDAGTDDDETDSAETAEETFADHGDEDTEADTEALAAEDTSSLYLDPAGTYDSADDVALYLYLYDELPSNYMTKKEAQALGWSGGSLEQYAEGMCIGGSYFGNNEGILPDEDTYHECDIDTLGASKRGAKRLVYSDDGDIYYTEDHYETFTLLYTADGPATEEVVYGG